MFPGGKNTPFEGELPGAVRDALAGCHRAGLCVNDIGAHEDMCATLLAAAGEPTSPTS